MDEMIPNTRYCTVHQLGWGMGVREVVGNYVGGYEAEFDVDAIVSEVTDWIDRHLPPNVNLIGDEVIGPAYGDSSAQLSVAELVEMARMDEDTFAGIVEKHERPGAS